MAQREEYLTFINKQIPPGVVEYSTKVATPCEEVQINNKQAMVATGGGGGLVVVATGGGGDGGNGVVANVTLLESPPTPCTKKWRRVTIVNI